MKLINWANNLIQRFIHEVEATATVMALFFSAEDVLDDPQQQVEQKPSVRYIERDSVSAPGWYALYKLDDGDTIQYPLVAWDITYSNDEPIESVGMVFIGNKPPFIEHASDSANFLGYKYDPVFGSESLSRVREASHKENRAASHDNRSLINTAYEELGEWG